MSLVKHENKVKVKDNKKSQSLETATIRKKTERGLLRAH